MELSLEQRKRISQLHDEYVTSYNNFVAELNAIVQSREYLADEQVTHLAEVRVRMRLVRQQIEQVDAELDLLGFWHRTYRSNPDIMKEAANRPISIQ